jgi:2-polyprenyl-6-methoxyphenol hydroxylase-like FAD-dependent oxidoreductase
VAEAKVQCCIAGGGPAGMMLGVLLARAGISVLVLEKHADFLRDFRGDTIHPSSLEVMHELGLLEGLLGLPHQKMPRLFAHVGDTRIPVADFRYLPVRCPYIAFMPQWDFLSFLAEHGRSYPGFALQMEAEVADLIQEGDRVVGVRAAAPDGPLEVRADLVVGADGRHSRVREAAGLGVRVLGAPMDVLWFGLTRAERDPEESMGRFEVGHIFVMINRGDYWQCGYVIPKGTLAGVRAAGLATFRDNVARMAPFVRDRIGQLVDWDQIKLLTVRVDRLERWWRPGLLCIGDAAHAMSPVGGVGINLAIQDAVGAANLLWRPLREGAPGPEDLARVQARRELPTRVTQWLQVQVQNRVIAGVLGGVGELEPPLGLRLLRYVPWLRRLPARLVGMGVRPEHVDSPNLGG